MTADGARVPVRWARMAITLGACLLVAGSAVAVWGVLSHAQALERLGAASVEVEEARADLENAREDLDDAADLAAWARDHARDGARLGRMTLAATERLVEFNRRLLELARGMELASLEGRLSDYNELADQIDAVAAEATPLLGRLREIFY